MATVFGNETYFGSGRWNKFFVRLAEQAYPFGGEVLYINSYVPVKMVIYGYNTAGYFEGTFGTSGMGTPNSYVSYRFIPFLSVTGYAIHEGVLYLKSDGSGEGNFVPGYESGQATYELISALEPDFELLIGAIHEAQKAAGQKLAESIDPPKEQIHFEQSKNQASDLGNQADELLKAKSLLDAGAISEEEFASLKKQILGL